MKFNTHDRVYVTKSTS